MALSFIFSETCKNTFNAFVLYVPQQRAFLEVWMFFFLRSIFSAEHPLTRPATQPWPRLFVRHPFDAGDRVEVVGISKPLYVRKMQLHYTLFSAWDGACHSCPFF